MARTAAVSSSRRSVVELLCLSAFFAFAAPGLPGCRERRAVTGPRLRVQKVRSGAPAPAVPALWLALATTDAAKRNTFLDDLDAALSSAEARKNPLLVDVLELDPKEVVDAARPWLLPCATAATALLTPRAESADGFRVDVIPRDAAPWSDDIAAWGPEEDAVGKRARFLAWPVARSLVVRAGPGKSLEDLRRALARAAADPKRGVALAASRETLEGRADPRITEVLRRLGRGAKLAGAGEEAALAATLPSEGTDLAPWIALADGELLVVPKLGAITPKDRFPSEVRRITQETGGAIVAGAA